MRQSASHPHAGRVSAHCCPNHAKVFRRAVELLLFCTAVPMMAIGCAEGPEVAYSPGTQVRTSTTKGEQQFNLYADGNKVPLACDMLLKNQRVGFTRDDSGRLIAVAGMEKHVLNEGHYHWRPMGSGAQTDADDSMKPVFYLVAVPSVALAMLSKVSEFCDATRSSLR